MKIQKIGWMCLGLCAVFLGALYVPARAGQISAEDVAIYRAIHAGNTRFLATKVKKYRAKPDYKAKMSDWFGAACDTKGNLTSAQFLLKNGANPNSKVGDGKTTVLANLLNSMAQSQAPQEWATGMRILQFLLKAKANPNARNKYRTTLHYLFLYPDEAKNKPLGQAATLLLRAGANPDIKDHSGRSVRDIVAATPAFSNLRPLFSRSVSANRSVATPKPVASSAQPKLQTGDILLSGSIGFVDGAGSSLVLKATAFTLPSGASNTLAEPKDKLVVVNAATVIRSQGSADNRELGDLKVGTAISVVGPDAGSGTALMAREIIVDY